jgi:hypothetical protein
MPGLPAEGERDADQGQVAGDGGGGADLEVGPAEFVFELFVALFDSAAEFVTRRRDRSERLVLG